MTPAFVGPNPTSPISLHIFYLFCTAPLSGGAFSYLELDWHFYTDPYIRWVKRYLISFCEEFLSLIVLFSIILVLFFILFLLEFKENSNWANTKKNDDKTWNVGTQKNNNIF